jgi:hypothetical protein
LAIADAVRFRFGAFEFPASTGELRRDGTVSREALREAVWGEAVSRNWPAWSLTALVVLREKVIWLAITNIFGWACAIFSRQRGSPHRIDNFFIFSNKCLI